MHCALPRRKLNNTAAATVIAERRLLRYRYIFHARSKLIDLDADARHDKRREWLIFCLDTNNLFVDPYEA